jgi:hypothetical protein
MVFPMNLENDASRLAPPEVGQIVQIGSEFSKAAFLISFLP